MSFRLLATMVFVFFLGCASLTFEGEESPEGAVFPHSAEWHHGESVVAKGFSVCADCHGEKGNQISNADCAECHDGIYPHSKNWETMHKSTLIDLGSTVSCGEKCHNNLESCGRCHDNYPHPEKWLNKHPTVAHQVSADSNLPLFDIAVGDQGLDSCLGRCHNTTHSIAGTCRNCHSRGVHSVDWKLPINHGKEALEEGLANCARCHGANFKGGELAPACSSCHTDFPSRHKEMNPNWLPESGGGEHAKTYLKQKREGVAKPCATCHTAGPAEGRKAPMCQTCHDYPHQGDSGTPWAATADGKKGRHADRFTEALKEGIEKPCLNCHGEDYLGGPSGVSCNQCHELSHIPGGNWQKFSSHGTSFLSDRERCVACHAAPFDFDDHYNGVPAQGNGETPQCYECHPAYPHVGYTLNGIRHDWSDDAPLPHFLFITRNRELLEGGGLSDPDLVESIRNTCGSQGGCHTDGRLSTPRPNTQPACNEVCHRE